MADRNYSTREDFVASSAFGKILVCTHDIDYDIVIVRIKIKFKSLSKLAAIMTTAALLLPRAATAVFRRPPVQIHETAQRGVGAPSCAQPAVDGAR